MIMIAKMKTSPKKDAPCHAQYGDKYCAMIAREKNPKLNQNGKFLCLCRQGTAIKMITVTKLVKVDLAKNATRSSLARAIKIMPRLRK